MKHIPLTQGQIAIVDDVDEAIIQAVGRWCYADGYAVHYYTDDKGKRKRLFMHRFVMEHVLGSPIPAGYQVDHISGYRLGKAARLDNRRTNLRLATRSQNQASKGPQINSSSGFKGINFRAGKYDVRLRYYRQRFYLGRYACLEEAKSVYAYAHRLLWGEFTTEQNIPEPSAVVQAYIQTAINHDAPSCDETHPIEASHDDS